MSIDWKSVQRVLIIRLRSIGDTVLATPSLIALKQFAPDAKVDILLEDWVAPLLDDFDAVDDVVRVGKSALSKLRTAREIRHRHYDVVVNLHGGTTSTFFAAVSGAPHRVGYSYYRYSFLYNYRLSSSIDYWSRKIVHSAEQQLALIGYSGLDVNPRTLSRLNVTASALASLDRKFEEKTGKALDKVERLALLHPAAAFRTKQWPEAKFAAIADYLRMQGFTVVSLAAAAEREVLERVAANARSSLVSFDNLDLPEIAALSSQADIFVGNDSGIAHIAAAVNTPVVVIFGSSNIDHWRPWTEAPNEVVRLTLPCQPCAGYECKVFGNPKCIDEIAVEAVTTAIDLVLTQS